MTRLSCCVLLICLVIMGIAIPALGQKSSRGCYSRTTGQPVPCTNPAPSSSSSTPALPPDPETLRRQMAANNASHANQDGLSLAARGEWLAAIAMYKKALDYTPGDAKIQRNLAYAQNEYGRQAWNNGDWKTALEYEREAAKNNAADPVIAGNLAMAEQKYKSDEWEKQYQRQGSEDAQRMRGTAGQLSQSLTAQTPVSTSGLDFVTDSSAGLTDVTRTQAATANNEKAKDEKAKDPESKASSGTRSADSGSLKQLPKALAEGKNATSFLEQGHLDDAKRTAENQWDTFSDATATPVDPFVRQAVPKEVADNPKYQALERKRAELARNRDEIDRKQAEIQRKQIKGEGDANELKKQADELAQKKNELDQGLQSVRMEELQSFPVLFGPSATGSSGAKGPKPKREPPSPQTTTPKQQ